MLARINMTTSSKTVFVGLSGGVDSSVAAARLIDSGYNVVGVFIKVWHPDWMVCNWEQERLDAMRVAAHLEIPFLTCDAVQAYKDDVADYFIGEYRAGRTPNPDVLCNQYVKFGRFLEFARDEGADYIATGHYAQNIAGELYRGVDQNKDQTYFLWALSNEQLKATLFPVGNTPKDQIRAEADKRGIPVAAKKDSQGICFLGHVDIPEFLSHYIDLTPGDVLNESGEVIGQHQGAQVYTLGQRHGFTIAHTSTDTAPRYVVKRDIEANTITVAVGSSELSTTDTLGLAELQLRTTLLVGDTVSFQIRYRQTPCTGTVTAITDELVALQADTAISAAPGQSCVIYRGDHCLGGGIIR